MGRVLVCALIAAASAVFGPWLTQPRSTPAGAPFAYEPPPGFIPASGAAVTEAAEAEGASVFVLEAASKRNFDGSPVDRMAALVRAVVHHSSKEMSVEEPDLAKLAADMPRVFEGTCAWTHRRHELRTRSDGARVGLIEGDCERTIDLELLGAPAHEVRARKLQLIFPDDTGTSIVTASYPTEQAARFEPLFEATIATARGVAVQAPAPKLSTRVAWAGAGGVLAWLAAALFVRRAPRGSAGKAGA